MPLILIDNYDSFTYNLYQLLQQLVAEPVLVYRNDQVDFAAVASSRPSHVVLSPGPGHPANARDFGICKDLIKRQRELTVPLLGVCLGHQGIVHHLGGNVMPAPQIVHGKTRSITLFPSPLFDGISSPMQVMRYHSLIASSEGFPDDLSVIAIEPSGELIMAVQHKRAPMYGVQFHPESIGTPFGQRLLRNFLTIC